MTGPQTTTEALVLALRLAITAPTDELAQKATEMAEELAATLTTWEVEACKAVAKETIDTPQDS